MYTGKDIIGSFQFDVKELLHSTRRENTYVINQFSVENNAFPDDIALNGIDYFIRHHPDHSSKKATKPVDSNFKSWSKENWGYFLDNVKFSYNVI